MVSHFRRALIYLFAALPAAAQSPAFAAISIKPASSSDPRNSDIRMLPNGDMVASAVSVITLLSRAYNVPVNPNPRLSANLPDWALHEKYDIEAKAPANTTPPGPYDSEVQARIQQTIRALLADRFHLAIRMEQKSTPFYALIVANGGPKLQPSTVMEKDCAFHTGTEPCHSFLGGLGHPLNGKAIDMDDVVHYIENWTDLPVVNRTALNGLFAVSTEGWLPMRLPPPPPNSAPSANPFAGLPTIFTVLGKLGLELKRQDGALPMYTVDHIERPTIN